MGLLGTKIKGQMNTVMNNLLGSLPSVQLDLTLLEHHIQTEVFGTPGSRPKSVNTSPLEQKRTLVAAHHTC